MTQCRAEFSVLMSVYKNDDSACFKEALQSVFSQTLPPAQVVLVADGPLNEPLEQVVAQYKDALTIVRLKQNGGLGAALQAGLKECAYPLVARMDSDDISLPNRFELQIKAFEADKNLSIVGGVIREIDFKTKEQKALRVTPLKDKEIKRYLKTRCPFNHVTVMFKKQDILDCGGYLPLHLMEDYYLWARCAAAGKKMLNLPDILVNVRVDAKMYGRRGGYSYFKSNKAVYKKMLELGIVNRPLYLFNLTVRFCVQVMLPNTARQIFYGRVLR